MSVTEETSGPATLLQALLAFQADAPTLQKDAVNPHFRNRYVSLDSLTQTITPILCKHGLVWTTLPCVLDGQPALRYRLAHAESGEAIEDVMPLLLAKNDAQGLGSSLTYGRRYAISAVLGLSADDDDGNAASPRQQSNGQARSQPSPAPTPDDVKEIVAAARGLSLGQIKTAMKGCGLPVSNDVHGAFCAVPPAKVPILVAALAETERAS